MLDRPAARKSHQVPTPYLGGVAIVAGVLTGVVVAVALSAAAGVVILAASLMSCVGLLDDDRLVEPRVRLLVAIGAACLVASVGVRLRVTGVPPIDTILTIVWIVGITNAVNFLDNMDGLAAGVAGTIG